MSQTLRLALLALLANGANTGYGLRRVLDQDLHHIWSARTQQIYHELARMDADGVIRITTTTARSNRPDQTFSSIPRPGLDQPARRLLVDPPAPASN